MQLGRLRPSSSIGPTYAGEEAIIGEWAKVGEASIAPRAKIGAKTKIGRGSVIEAEATMGRRMQRSRNTNFPREVCEMALAHSVGNAVEAAYRRGDLFEKRRKLMLAWSSYVLTVPSGKVLAMRRLASWGVYSSIGLVEGR